MSPSKSHRFLRRWLTTAWLLYWAAMFVATHLPKFPKSPISVRHGDKIIHCLMFLCLTILGGWAHRLRYRKTTVVVLLTWSVLYTVYAALDEWLQGWVSRTPSVEDWAADVLGILAGTLVLLWFGRGKSVVEVKGDFAKPTKPAV